ncbi:MAG TPA: ABC transporter substrate-binding protein [Noviherbaspirillum sp.]
MKRRRILAAGCGVAAVAAVPALRTSAQEQPIVLGQSAPLTGPASELGLQFMQGAQCHFHQVNARGGVAGRRIELHTLDDGYDPEQCARNTKQFIERGVFALFGYIGTATSVAAMPMIVEARKLFIAPFSGSEALRIPYYPFVFHLRASYVDETTAIVRHLLSLGIRRIGVFYQDDSEGKSGLLGVGRAMKLQYLAPTGIGKVERNSVDVDLAVRTILAEKPDAIVLISTYLPCAAVIRSARKAGYSGMFCTISSVGTQALARELSQESRGVIVSQVMPYPYAVTTPLAGDYLAAGKAAMGAAFAPSYSGIEGYVAARVFAEAMHNAKKFSQEGAIAALESLHDFDLGGFDVSLAPGKHVASRLVELTILTADGKIRR